MFRGMQLVSPELLADARGLTAPLTAAALAIGVFLWLFGWWSHRFWVVLVTTVGAGIWGLHHGAQFNSHPLAVALLLSVSSGLLALAMVRLLAFGAGGLVATWVLQSSAPQIDQPIVIFLVGGLGGLFLFRLWIMSLTSMMGALLASYAGLCLLERTGSFDAVQWTTQGEALLTWLMGFIAFTGVAFQFLFDRRSRRNRDKMEEHEDRQAMLPRMRSLRRAG